MSIVQPPRVNVLISTYNGAQYIEQLLDSVLSQIDVELFVYIRDDGSTDGTVGILKVYSDRFANVTVSFGKNVGYISSFFELILNMADIPGLFALCDQDDVWLPNKLSAAAGLLNARSEQIPKMYFSRTEYVDSELKHLAYSADVPARCVGYSNALVQNVATGCTIVFNKSAQLLVSENLPQRCLVHDWWVYLVVSCFGEVIYDPRTFIKYRQHQGNAIGATGSVVDAFVRRLKRFLVLKPDFRITTQLSEFQRIFAPHLSEAQRKDLGLMLESKGSVWARVKLVFSRAYTRTTWFDNFILRTMMLLGKF